MEIHNLTGLSLKHVYGIIYGLENRYNHRTYIGQTIQEIRRRIYNHKIAKTCIGNAIRKYAADGFFIVVLDVCENKEQLNQPEMKWIAQLNCKYSNGYNLTDGGESPLA